MNIFQFCLAVPLVAGYFICLLATEEGKANFNEFLETRNEDIPEDIDWRGFGYGSVPMIVTIITIAVAEFCN